MKWFSPLWLLLILAVQSCGDSDVHIDSSLREPLGDVLEVLGLDIADLDFDVVSGRLYYGSTFCAAYPCGMETVWTFFNSCPCYWRSDYRLVVFCRRMALSGRAQLHICLAGGSPNGLCLAFRET